jgi:BatD DUF11 like domain
MALYVFAVGRTSAAVPDIDATLEPAQIAVGESAQLTILASGSGTLSVPLPVVSGLEFRVVGQSRRVQIVNGAAISSTSTIIRVTPEVAGIFTIPGITPRSAPLLLRVNPAGSTGNSATLNGPGGKPSILPGGATPEGIRLTPDGSAFIRLDMPKRDIYVGESIPVDIQVGMRQGFAGINGLPTLNSSDFTLNNLSHQPEQSEKNVGGKLFTVVTWHSLLAAVKPGSYSLNVQAPLRVRIRTQPQRESLLDDLLGDPFMQNFFGASVMKDIIVTSPQSEFTVLALPTEGRPQDFSGAVGSFKITSDVSPATAAAGDPLTLRMHVTGSGNFDRVDSAMFGGDGHWKTYVPKAMFKSGDATGYKGEKVFEQPLIATRAGTQNIPALAFSFFEPTSRRYQTAHSSALNVTISPSAAESSPNAASSSSPVLAPNAAVPQGGLRPDHVARAPMATSLTPLYFQPRFLAAPSVAVLLFAATWVNLRRRERHADETRRKNVRFRAQLEQILEQMQVAASAGDATSFFNAARDALRHSLGHVWKVAPEDISAADIDARLGTQGAEIQQILTLADEANYSGSPVNSTDFERWSRVVRAHIATERTT